MDPYSQGLVFNADEAIQAVQSGDTKTALLILRHMRDMLANGLPIIISLALENRTLLNQQAERGGRMPG